MFATNQTGLFTYAPSFPQIDQSPCWMDSASLLLRNPFEDHLVSLVPARGRLIDSFDLVLGFACFLVYPTTRPPGTSSSMSGWKKRCRPG